ncbi:hypothetical protein ACVWY2_003082 [Bradyrhizobium sp. JR6.1]
MANKGGEVCCWVLFGSAALAIENSVSGVKRTSRLRPPTSKFDPGCVKTPLLCYDSLVILRGKLMRRFVKQADRVQWTLLPECLDDFIDESNPFA